MIWTDKAVARLKELWGTGKSCAEIGRMLGCSKNAVIGKAHRLSLGRSQKSSGRDVISNRAKRRKPKPRLRRSLLTGAYELSSPARSAPRQIAITPADMAGGMDYMAYRLGRDCATILTPPRAASKLVCGRPVKPGQSFCPDCYGRLFYPAKQAAEIGSRLMKGLPA